MSSSPALPPPDRLDDVTRLAIGGLGVTQIISWGSTYYLLSILGAPISRDLGLSPAVVSSGLSIMLVLGAVFGPAAGRMMDRQGARMVMAIGSVIAAAGLMLLSGAQSLAGYLVAWLVIGLSSPLVLYPAAFTALTQIAPAQARRAITFLTLPGGLASTVFWPLTEWLLGGMDWRSVCQIYALLNLALCLPLHLAVIRRGPGTMQPGQINTAPGAGLPQDARRAAFLLLAGALALNALLVTGVLNQFMVVMRALGQSTENAVLFGMIFGISQTSARVLELAGGARFDALHMGLAVSTGFPVAVLFLVADPGAAWAGLMFAMLLGACNGLWTIVRGALVLRLFGVRGYGENLGVVIVAQGIAAAAAPIALAGLLDSVGAQMALLFLLAVSGLALVAMASLFRHASRVLPRSS